LLLAVAEVGDLVAVLEVLGALEVAHLMPHLGIRTQLLLALVALVAQAILPAQAGLTLLRCP